MIARLVGFLYVGNLECSKMIARLVGSRSNISYLFIV